VEPQGCGPTSRLLVGCHPSSGHKRGHRTCARRYWIRGALGKNIDSTEHSRLCSPESCLFAIFAAIATQSAVSRRNDRRALLLAVSVGLLGARLNGAALARDLRLRGVGAGVLPVGLGASALARDDGDRECRPSDRPRPQRRWRIDTFAQRVVGLCSRCLLVLS